MEHQGLEPGTSGTGTGDGTPRTGTPGTRTGDGTSGTGTSDGTSGTGAEVLVSRAQRDANIFSRRTSAHYLHKSMVLPIQISDSKPRPGQPTFLIPSPANTYSLFPVGGVVSVNVFQSGPTYFVHLHSIHESTYGYVADLKVVLQGTGDGLPVAPSLTLVCSARVHVLTTTGELAGFLPDTPAHGPSGSAPTTCLLRIVPATSPSLHFIPPPWTTSRLAAGLPLAGGY
ncbi:hypothetical protein EYF80_028041 [Liparis tanakae]|uniref:Uncharacterized protein n=1 Tax=Liparis tanakae TaxID=230148 RepID=A0A4Z2HAD0_9TELE|nr:hypothetical protein EYF80_028041 [Liparis tanakae]